MYSFAVYIVNGMARAGKDKFVEYIEDFSKDVLIVHRMSTIDTVNDILCKLGWWDGVTKDDAYRLLASQVKNAWAQYCDGPNQDIYQQIAEILAHFGKNKKHIFFIMCREPEEILKIKNKYGIFAKTIFVENPNVPDITSNMSDANVRNFEYDYLINNNGTLDDLYKDAQNFCAIIRDTVTYHVEEEIMTVVDLNKFRKEEAVDAEVTDKSDTEVNPENKLGIEPAEKYGLSSGNVIANLNQDLSSVTILNPEYAVKIYKVLDDNGEPDFTVEGEDGIFRDLVPGDLFSVPGDIPNPEKVYTVLTPIVLWQKKEGEPFTYMAIVDPVYDPKVLLKEDLVIGDMLCKQKHSGVTIYAKDNPSTPVLFLGVSVLRQMQQWYSNIMG